MAGQHQANPIWGYVNSPPILVYFSGDSEVQWGYGVLTRGHVCVCVCVCVSLAATRSLTSAAGHLVGAERFSQPVTCMPWSIYDSPLRGLSGSRRQNSYQS